MRILAIRGENLASLAGSFEIRFDQGRLAASGVYAITGATGAGKSTILDAMCLALFGQTPRLQGRGGARLAGDPDDKKEALTQDPRQLLRRGSGRGFAEVEFIGQDDRRYRTRWEVQRANKKVDGRLQPARRSFEEIDGKSGASLKNSEVANLVVDRLGLDFDQFRRSVLLAQGEFAAFLRASSNEKALLLEQMTDTSLYAEVSKLAHERGRDSQAEIERLTSEIAAVICLDAVERQSLEVERDLAKSELARLSDEDRLVRRHLEWYATDARLAEDVEAAARTLEAARAAVETAAERRRGVDLAVRVQDEFGAKHRELVELEARRRAADTELETLRESLRTSLLDRDANRVLVAAAAAAVEKAVAARKSAEADLRLARELDLELRRLEEAKAAAVVDATNAKAARVAAERGVERAMAARDAAARELSRCEAAVDACRADAGWAESHGALDQRLDGLERLRHEVAELETKRRVLYRRAHVLDRAIRMLDGKSMRSEARWTELRSAVEGARRRRESLDRAMLETQRRESVARKEILRRLDELFAERDAATVAVRSCETALDAAREVEGRLRTALDQASTRVTELQRTVEEREDAARDARIAEAAIGLRATLVAGEPCLVCGSRDHPGGMGEADTRTIVELDLAIASAKAELGRAREAHRATDIESTRVATERSALEKERSKCAASVESVRGRIGTRLAELARDAKVELLVDSSRADLHAVAESFDVELRSIDERLAEVNSLDVESERLRAELDAVQPERECVRETKARWQAELAAAREAATEAEASLVVRNQKHEVLREQVLALLSNLDDRRALQVDVTDLRRQLAQRADAWRRAGRERQVAADALTKSEAPLGAAGTEARLRAESEREANDRLAREADRLAAAITRRKSILDGRIADVVERELDDAVTKSTIDRDTSTAKLTLLEDGCAKSSGKVERASLDAERLASDLRAMRAAFDRAVGESGLEPTLVVESLLRDPHGIQADRDALRAIDTHFEAARIRNEERRRSRDRHGEAAPDESKSTCDERLEAVTAAIAGRRERETEVAGRLGRDDGAREQRRSLEARREEVSREAGVWARLAELIGSHDGRKLRVFAQGLTLDVLVRETNRRLADLAPRYHLQRIRGAELELAVIDRDMGGDIRGIESLSGGETFLVSLALALGLSSLAGRRARIESLFIDEGFGTLDAQSLDQALSVLDALQSTGTQVGVISHVGGLAERLGVSISVEKRGPGTSIVRCP